MTKGSDKETLDGINRKCLENTIDSLKSGKFKFRPSRRVEIFKSNGKMRPLGLQSPRDNIK